MTDTETTVYTCPNCTDGTITQEITQHERVITDEQNEPVSFDATHMDINYIKCEDCNEIIHNYR